MKRLFAIVMVIASFVIMQQPSLSEAACTGGSGCISSTFLKKGVENFGKVWYETVFGSGDFPRLGTDVVGLQRSSSTPPEFDLSPLVNGFLACVHKTCLTDSTSPRCTVPGGAQGTPYQVEEDQISITAQSTACAVKGQKGTCKVQAYDFIQNADLESKLCPGGFVPDFTPDPFIGRIFACDPSQGDLVPGSEQDSSGDYSAPQCTGGTAAITLCMLVAGAPGTIGQPYATQVEVPNDGTIITTEDYGQLGCTPETLKP
jgi:hypothetical protein